MRILLISQDFLPGLPGGIASYLHHLCAQLERDVHVLTPATGAWEAFDARQSYHIHRRAIPIGDITSRRTIQLRPAFLLRIARLALLQFILFTWHGCRIVWRERVDCVLIAHLYLAPVGWLLRLLTGRPYAVILYGSELQRYWHIAAARKLAVGGLNQADFLIVISEFTRQQYIERGVRADQTFVKISPGVDEQRFHPGLNPAPIVQRHGLAGRAVILTVARLVEWKGQDIVIRALPHILSATPNAVYVIVGQGPHRGALEASVAELGLQEHVIFAGFVPDEELPLYYAAADVVVLVSREVQLIDPAQGGKSNMPIEGFGIVYLEAGAAGRPVVGGRAGGVAEAVSEGHTGLLANPRDAQDVARQISRLLTDRELARRMGLNGRARVEREFTWKAQAAALRAYLSGAPRHGSAH